MNAPDNAKPPRPCTEYNIFFQLERAYILQVLLQTEPTINHAADVFNPSQASYAGLPPLPRRYASLVLPYDWHLPGKERRRKRKHRKSHGAIGFHDLSNRIANAWRAVDAEVKAYCSQVCAVGLANYKDAVIEWKRNGGQEQMAPHKKRRDFKAKAASVQDPEEVNSIDNRGKKKEEDGTSVDFDFTPVLQVLAQNEAPIPTPIISQEVATGEISQVFENDIVLTGEEEVQGMWDIQGEPFALEPAPLVGADAVISSNPVGTNVQDDSRMVDNNQAEYKVLRNASIVPIETVDMDDNEIFRIWNSCDDIVSNQQRCTECTPAVPAAIPSSTATVQPIDNTKADQYDSLFGLKGYARTMQDMQRMKLILDEQVAQLGKVRRPARRCSVVARCA